MIFTIVWYDGLVVVGAMAKSIIVVLEAARGKSAKYMLCKLSSFESVHPQSQTDFLIFSKFFFFYVFKFGVS